MVVNRQNSRKGIASGRNGVREGTEVTYVRRCPGQRAGQRHGWGGDRGCRKIGGRRETPPMLCWDTPPHGLWVSAFSCIFRRKELPICKKGKGNTLSAEEFQENPRKVRADQLRCPYKRFGAKPRGVHPLQSNKTHVSKRMPPRQSGVERVLWAHPAPSACVWQSTTGLRRAFSTGRGKYPEDVVSKRRKDGEEPEK